MGRKTISISGSIIALVGFVLTRFTVTLAATETTSQFLFAGVVPLILGLSLSAFGVILTVGAYDTDLVRTTAAWCLIGTGTMAILVILTLLGSRPETMMDAQQLREQTYLSNFLIGGAIGGTLTGLYASQNRRQRSDLRQQANRLILLNRLLRDEVINAATAIKGHTSVLKEGTNEQSVDVIDKQATNVIDIVENVKYLSDTADKSTLSLGDVELVECVEDEFATVARQYPDAECHCSSPDEQIMVRANSQLREVFRHLCENALAYSDADTPQLDVTVEATRKIGRVRIEDNGPGLPDSQQALLETGEIAEFDDPTSGFGLNIVRLLVESFEGSIETTVTDAGSTIVVELPRTGTAGTAANPRALTVPGVAPSRITLAVFASLVAGGTMALAMWAAGGPVPVIGALYGVENWPVAIITHEFHSIVFGLLYAGILSAIPISHARGLLSRISIAGGLGIGLWLFAAGIIMPIWLRFVGTEAPLPNLTMASFVGHVVWGLTLGVLYHMGDSWLERIESPERFAPSAFFPWR